MGSFCCENLSSNDLGGRSGFSLGLWNTLCEKELVLVDVILGHAVEVRKAQVRQILHQRPVSAANFASCLCRKAAGIRNHRPEAAIQHIH